MKTWRTLLALASVTGGMLAGGLLAATPADAQTYYRHDPPPIAQRRADDRRFAGDRRFAEEHRARERYIEHRQWVAAHWEYRDGHRFWHDGYRR